MNSYSEGTLKNCEELKRSKAKAEELKPVKKIYGPHNHSEENKYEINKEGLVMKDSTKVFGNHSSVMNDLLGKGKESERELHENNQLSIAGVLGHGKELLGPYTELIRSEPIKLLPKNHIKETRIYMQSIMDSKYNKSSISFNSTRKKGLWIFCNSLGNHAMRAKKDNKYMAWSKEEGFMLNNNRNFTLKRFIDFMHTMRNKEISSLSLCDFNKTVDSELPETIITFVSLFPRLTHLNLSGGKISAGLLANFLESEGGIRLKCLILDNVVTDSVEGMVEAIVDHLSGTSIEHFSAEGTPLNDLVSKLADSGALKKLRWLSLYYNKFSFKTVAECDNFIRTIAKKYSMRSIQLVILNRGYIFNSIIKISYPKKINSHYCEL